MKTQFTGGSGDLYNPKVSSDSVIDMPVAANTNLTNLSSNGLQNVGNVMFPSNNYINVTRTKKDNVKYTAPEDGWFYVSDSVGGDAYGTTLVNITLGTFAATSQLTASRYNIGNQGCFIPCRKGDEVIIGFYLYASTMITRFYYAGGH